MRTHLSKGLGFSKEDRDTNIGRIGWVASRFTRAGVVTLVSAISPYADTRAAAREMVEEFGPFVEIFVDTSVDECAKRDVKGLYAKAFSGEIKEFTGVSDPYEAPGEPRGPHHHRVPDARGERGARHRRARGARPHRRGGHRVDTAPRADLHTHTVASDGRLAPAALVALAREHGVGVLAVTDHDTMDGCPRGDGGGIGAGRPRDRRRRAVGPAPSGSFHLLGYFPGPGEPEPLAGAPRRAARGPRDRGRTAWSSAWPRPARRSSFDDVSARAAGAIGRPHVADALVAAGHARDRQDAFDRYLADGGPGFVPHEGLQPREAIALVADSGGAPVLAHPASLRMPERELAGLRAAARRLGPARASRCTGPTTRPSGGPPWRASRAATA